MASLGLNSIPVRERKKLEKQIKDFSKSLKEKRIYLGLTQEDVAEIVDCSTQNIRFIENGRYTPSLVMFLRIANALDVKVTLS